jgi:hypothetical protein
MNSNNSNSNNNVQKINMIQQFRGTKVVFYIVAILFHSRDKKNVFFHTLVDIFNGTDHIRQLCYKHDTMTIVIKALLITLINVTVHICFYLLL